MGETDCSKSSNIATLKFQNCPLRKTETLETQAGECCISSWSRYGCETKTLLSLVSRDGRDVGVSPGRSCTSVTKRRCHHRATNASGRTESRVGTVDDQSRTFSSNSGR